MAVIAFVWFIYTNFLLEQKENILQTTYNSFGVVEKNINQHVNEMMRIALNIDGSGDFLYHSNKMTVLQRDKMINELERYTIGNGFINNIGYYSMLDPEYIYSDLGQYTVHEFGKYLYRLPEIQANSGGLHKILGIVKAENVIHPLDPTDSLTFICGTPFASAQKWRYILFFVEKSRMDDMVSDVIGHAGVSLGLYDQGRLVYAFNPQGDIWAEASFDWEHIPIGLDTQNILELESFVYFPLNSSSHQWKLIMKYDKRLLFADYLKNQLFYFTVIGILALMLLIMAFLATAYTYSPVYSLMKKYTPNYSGLKTAKLDELDYLGSVMDLQINNKLKMQRKLFFSNVIWGQYTDESLLQEDMEEAMVAFNYRYFTCCTLYYSAISNSGERPLPDVLACGIKALLQLWPMQGISIDLCGCQGIVVIVNHQSEAVSAELQQVFAELNVDGRENYNCNLTIGIGVHCEQITDLAESAQKSREAVDFALLNNLGCVCYERMSACLKSPTITDFSMGLAKLIQQDKWSAMVELVDKAANIVADNDSNLISRSYVYHLAYEQVWEAVECVAQDFPEYLLLNQDIPIAKLQDADGIRDRLEKICGTMAQIISQNKSHNKHISTELRDKIIEVISKNIFNNSLSLESISEDCGVTPSYLVRYFKAQTGTPPMQYVDTCRMAKAKELLRTTNYTLRQIVDCSGYIDESNFARKFKKLEGVTPMRYRKEHSL